MICLPLNVGTVATVKMDLLLLLISPSGNFKESDYLWASFFQLLPPAARGRFAWPVSSSLPAWSSKVIEAYQTVNTHSSRPG